MFLDRVTISGLAKMLEPHMGRPAWPGLDDPAVRKRSAEWAKELGLWERLSSGMESRTDPSAPIPVIRRSDYRDYRRTGSRRRGEACYFERVRRTTEAATRLWLGHPAGDVDHLHDLLWAWCETSTWIWPAHEGRTIDLGSSAIGRMLAEIVRMFEGELEDEVKDRVGSEVDRRILDGACDWRRPDGWQTVEMNWNHVCNANIITTALYRIEDARVLAAYIHPLIRRLAYAIDGFADDGGCREGPSYWDYGFGHFLDAAVVLHNRTGGELRLVEGEKIAMIARYPLAAHIEGRYRTTFADSSHGFLKAENALKINRFLDIPELFAAAGRTEEGFLDVADWRGLSIYDGEKAAGSPEARDCLLPDLGQAKLRAGEGDSRATLVVLAGSNDVPHNHNDIGSFMYFARGKPLLTDPGAPMYTRKTFGPKRYEILFCRSRGHSVPVVNGKEQPAGSSYRGTLAVSGLDSTGEKRATIDMTRAYDDATLEKLVREFVLSPDGGLTLTDTYEFTRRPESLEEAFITYEKAALLEGGRAVRVGEPGEGVTISAEGVGAFEVDRLVEESKEGRTAEVVSRITFRPAKLAKSIKLAFKIA